VSARGAAGQRGSGAAGGKPQMNHLGPKPQRFAIVKLQLISALSTRRRAHCHGWGGVLRGPSRASPPPPLRRGAHAAPASTPERITR
jgi:hypothetical protein